jgi:glutamate carboxypeptidase
VDLLDFLKARQEGMVADLREFVRRESPSTDKHLLDQFAEFLAGYAEGFGGYAEIIPMQDSGNHVRVRWGDGEAEPILLLGHFDTVWPVGTLQRMPFQATGNLARGPGVFDMKAGLVQGFWAVRALHQVSNVRRPIVFLCNADEEIGSPSSSPLIEAEAGKARVVWFA